MERNIKYERNNIGYDDQYLGDEGSGIKCKNYEICKAVLPKWWFECKGSYLCTNCDMMFGTWTSKCGRQHRGKGALPITANAECSICLELARSVSQPNCDHTICISCFKRCYFGDESGEPDFPYPDIEDDYYEDPENPNWAHEYPFIQIYNKEWNRWDEEKSRHYEAEAHLRKCPSCRK